MERKTFIDVAKGIAMLLVVMQHTGGQLDSGMRFLCKVDVPLFFLCSGFLAYRPRIDVSRHMLKACRRILVPFILACLFACVYFNENISDVFLSSGKRGYWFLEALFFMMAIFMVIHRNEKLLVAGGVLIEAGLLICSKYFPETVDNVLGISYLSRYFPCFIMGALMRKHNVESLPNKWVGLVLLAISVGCLIYGFSSTNASFLAHVVGYLSFSVLTFFVIKRCTDGLPDRLKAAFGYVGRYSLNVYIIHFYFVFYLPIEGGDFLIDFVLSASAAIVVTALSITLGKVLTYCTPLNKVLTA